MIGTSLQYSCALFIFAIPMMVVFILHVCMALIIAFAWGSVLGMGIYSGFMLFITIGIPCASYLITKERGRSAHAFEGGCVWYHCSMFLALVFSVIFFVGLAGFMTVGTTITGVASTNSAVLQDAHYSTVVLIDGSNIDRNRLGLYQEVHYDELSHAPYFVVWYVAPLLNANHTAIAWVYRSGRAYDINSFRDGIHTMIHRETRDKYISLAIDNSCSYEPRCTQVERVETPVFKELTCQLPEYHRTLMLVGGIGTMVLMFIASVGFALTMLYTCINRAKYETL